LLLAFDYPFTNHRVTLSIYASRPPTVLTSGQQWIPLVEIDRIALAAPHRRAIKRLTAEHHPTPSLDSHQSASKIS
jgi:A/G-specific adenine glycosylase